MCDYKIQYMIIENVQCLLSPYFKKKWSYHLPKGIGKSMEISSVLFILLQVEVLDQ